MFRLSLLALGATVVVLVVLSLLPARTRTVPGGTIVLSGAQVTLYPQADPEAVWTFASERVDYQPDSGETVLRDIGDSARTVGGEVDFTLASERITIDAEENLRGESIEVYVPDVQWTLDMRAGGGKTVLLDQQQGRFVVLAIDITDGNGDSISSSKNFSMNFDLTDTRTGGAGTKNSDSFRDRAD